MANEMKKKIKILSKGVVLTSRGMARTPIDRPYLESINSILLLITRYKADVVEVLPDGREVKLTINNFNIDNTKVNEVAIENEGDTKEKKVDPVPVQPAISKNMSRKERKRLEAERRRAEQLAQQNAADTKESETTNDVQSTEEKVVEDTKDEIIMAKENEVVDDTKEKTVEENSTDEVAPTETSKNPEISVDELPDVPVE